MSDFVQQNPATSSFDTSESWVILSPIELSIKRKIEAVGVPLKDWNIQINYGIKTGFNDAFIISTEKRNEILANCANEDERSRTDELIRPLTNAQLRWTCTTLANYAYRLKSCITTAERNRRYKASPKNGSINASRSLKS